MKNKLFILFFFLISFFTLTFSNNIKWESKRILNSIPKKILKIKSHKNYLLYDNIGNIYKYKNKVILKYKPNFNFNKKYRSIHMLFITNHYFIATAITQSFNTHFYKIKHMEWKKSGGFDRIAVTD